MITMTTMPFAEFGARLTAARESAGLSQADLCRAANVRQSSLSGWELGRNPPPSDALARMAKAIGVPVDSLITADLLAKLPRPADEGEE